MIRIVKFILIQTQINTKVSKERPFYVNIILSTSNCQ